MVIVGGMEAHPDQIMIYINHPNAATRVRGVLAHRTASRRHKFSADPCEGTKRSDKVKKRLQKKLKEKKLKEKLDAKRKGATTH